MNTQEPLEDFEHLYTKAISTFNLNHFSTGEKATLKVHCQVTVEENPNATTEQWLSIVKTKIIKK